MKDLSFVIPAYNAENVIEKCLHEILKIKKIDIEVVVVDDGSVDSTPTIVQKIGDERIRLLTQKNRGVSQARNNGIKNATGKYIAFVDADDYIYPDIYEEIFVNINSEIDFTMFQYESMNGIQYFFYYLKFLYIFKTVQAKQTILCKMDTFFKSNRIFL